MACGTWRGLVEHRRGLRADGALAGDEVTGNDNRDLRIALDGHAAGEGVREIATDLYGVDRVAADWGPDRGFRTGTRRLLRKARENAGRASFGAVAEHDTPGLCAPFAPPADESATEYRLQC